MTGETHPPVHPGDQINAVMIARIYDGMRACTLPKQEWTHGGHLVCGCAILADLGLDEAEAQMPGMIRRYNISTGVRTHTRTAITTRSRCSICGLSRNL